MIFRLVIWYKILYVDKGCPNLTVYGWRSSESDTRALVGLAVGGGGGGPEKEGRWLLLPPSVQ